jgi:glutathione S-transferase
LVGSSGGNNEPTCLELNPNGRVPTLIDGSFVLWESNAGTLYPIELERRADMERWMDWQQTILRPRSHTLFDALKETTRHDAARTETLRQDLDAAWQILDAQLAKGELHTDETRG